MTQPICQRASASWPFALVAALALAAAANPSPGDARTRANDEFLLPEQAFKLAARLADERSIELSFDIAPGYYLYREQFRFEAGSGASLGPAVVPTGQVKFDETFQKNVETHRGRLVVTLPVQQAKGAFRLAVTYQGCADKGLCYPPQQWQADVRLAAFGGEASLRPVAAEAPLPTVLVPVPPPAPESSVATERPAVRWLPWLGGAALLAAIAAAWLLRRRRAADVH